MKNNFIIQSSRLSTYMTHINSFFFFLKVQNSAENLAYNDFVFTAIKTDTKKRMDKSIAKKNTTKFQALITFQIHKRVLKIFYL